jgi:hypothetical protein
MDGITATAPAPRAYSAFVGGEHVETRRTLEALLAVLEELCGPGGGEDVAVWCDHKLAAVRFASGSLLSVRGVGP